MAALAILGLARTYTTGRTKTVQCTGCLLAVCMRGRDWNSHPPCGRSSCTARHRGCDCQKLDPERLSREEKGTVVCLNVKKRMWSRRKSSRGWWPGSVQPLSVGCSC
jgi:hypothetical protein